MRRRALSLFFCAALLLGCALLPGQARAATALFVATNNDVLPLSTQAVSSGGSYYVPYAVFNAFGIYYSPVDSTHGMLYSGSTAKYFFDLQNGGCQDGDDNTYSASAMLRGGTVCVPVKFICDHFGLVWSYLTGSEYGDILRVRNGAAVISDKNFPAAASSAMRWELGQAGGSSPSAAPTSKPTATPKPSPTPDKSTVRVRICFAGLPDASALDLLDANGVKACFFVTADDVRQNADELRRIAGSGHKLGVLLDPADCAGSFGETAALLFEAAHIDTVLCASVGGDEETCAAFARERGLCFVAGDLTLSDDLRAVTSALAERTAAADIRVVCGTDTAAPLGELLGYLKASKFDIEPMLEVGAG